jgi:hypothetical protein
MFNDLGSVFTEKLQLERGVFPFIFHLDLLCIVHKVGTKIECVKVADSNTVKHIFSTLCQINFFFSMSKKIYGIAKNLFSWFITLSTENN